MTAPKLQELSRGEYAQRIADLSAAGVRVPVEATTYWDAYDATQPGRDQLGYFGFEFGRFSALLSFKKNHIHGMTFGWARSAPVWNEPPPPEAEVALAKALRQHFLSARAGLTFLRLQFCHPVPGTLEPSQHLSYDRTVVVDLTGTPEEILGRMKKRGRRDVRRAGRQNLVVTRETDIARQDLAPLVAIMEDTGSRGGFRVLSEQAYWNFLETLRAQGVAELLVCREGDESGAPVAWTMITNAAGLGTYYFAASTPAGRKLGAPDLLVWEAMQLLSKEGAQSFDLMGIGSEYAPSFQSLTNFKNKFTEGEEVVATYREIVLKPAGYRAMELAAEAKETFQRYLGNAKRWMRRSDGPVKVERG